MKKCLFGAILLAGCASTPRDMGGRESRDLQGLTRDTVKNTFRAYRGDIRDCYNQALAVNPTLQGKMVVAFKVEKTGAVSDAEVRGSTMESESFNKCLVSKIQNWKFPEANRTTEIKAYPLYFHVDK